jgi:hypothetical protein
MKPKNLPSASVHTGSGDVDTPVSAQAVTVFLVAPSPTSRLVSFSARAVPPGSSASVRPGAFSSASIAQAVVSIGPPNVD